MARSIPRLLWVSIATLAVTVLAKALLSIRFGPFLLLDAAAWGVILFGLIVAQRWAYVLAVAITVLETVLLTIRMGGVGIAALVLNALVLAPVLLCTDHFFAAATPERAERRSAS